MTFKEYASQRRVTFHAFGDFNAEVRKNRQLAAAKTWPELEALLKDRQSLSAMQAAKDVWRDYVIKSRKQDGRIPKTL